MAGIDSNMPGQVVHLDLTNQATPHLEVLRHQMQSLSLEKHRLAWKFTLEILIKAWMP